MGASDANDWGIAMGHNELLLKWFDDMYNSCLNHCYAAGMVIAVVTKMQSNANQKIIVGVW